MQVPQAFAAIQEMQEGNMHAGEEDDMLTPLNHPDMQEQPYSFNKSGQPFEYIENSALKG